MLAIVSLPAPATFLTDITAWSSPLFDDLLPLAEYAIGISVGCLLVAYLVYVATGAIARLIR